MSETVMEKNESIDPIEARRSEDAIGLLQEVQVLMNQDVDDNFVYANLAIHVKEKIEAVIKLLQEG